MSLRQISEYSQPLKNARDAGLRRFAILYTDIFQAIPKYSIFGKDLSQVLMDFSYPKMEMVKKEKETCGKEKEDEMYFPPPKRRRIFYGDYLDLERKRVRKVAKQFAT